MSEKKYSIVRVDNNCPFMQEKLDFSSCSKMFNCDKFIRCEKCEHNCRYGDTKEQLIRKVAQAIKKSLRQGFTKGYKDIATDVIEFLGVEDDYRSIGKIKR